MKHLFSVPILLLLVCLVCLPTSALAAPGDTVSAHAQLTASEQAAAPAATEGPGDLVSSTVAASAPLLGPYGAFALVFAPIIGMLTNVWWRWRGKDLDEKKRLRLTRLRDLATAGIALAAELKAKGDPTVQTGPQRLDTAISYVVNKAIDEFDTEEIADEIHSLLGRISGVGATGTAAIQSAI